MPTAADIARLQAELDALKAGSEAEPEPPARERLAGIKDELAAYRAAPYRYNSAFAAELHARAVAAVVDVLIAEAPPVASATEPVS